MGWIVEGSKESAEAAGSDPEGDELMFAITPNNIAKIYNYYRNDFLDKSELSCEDRWELLSDKQRGKLLDAIEDYIRQIHSATSTRNSST